MPENTKDPTPYVPPTPEERRASLLESIRYGLSKIPALSNQHIINIQTRTDAVEKWYEGDWIKYLPQVFPELKK